MHSTNERVVHALRDRGRDLAVETWAADGKQHARLLRDGEAVEEKAVGALEEAKFDLGTVEEEGESIRQRVRVKFRWKGKVRGCDLVEVPEGERPRRPAVTPFVPPAGTRARRKYELRERYPRLYAMRHVAAEAMAIVVGFLGISALLSALLGRLLPGIDWSWLPGLPDLPRPPEWLRYLTPHYWIKKLLPDDPFGWLPGLPDLPDLPDVDLPWLKYVLPLLFALGIALKEIDRRRKREERERRFDEAGEGGEQAGHRGD